jgi:hypothetical protein
VLPTAFVSGLHLALICAAVAAAAAAALVVVPLTPRRTRSVNTQASLEAA